MQDIDDIMDAQHLADISVVNSLSDVAPLKEAAKSYCINVPHIIQYFSKTITDVVKKVPGYEETTPQYKKNFKVTRVKMKFLLLQKVSN